MSWFIILLIAGCWAYPAQDPMEVDGPVSRKILGSSVVTSVSVIMDGALTHFSDAVGKPVAKPASSSQVASPINLLNPDRYEFYTFDDSGDLVKRLMTLEEIHGIIANGDGEGFTYSTNYNSPEKKVDDVVTNVQNVLKSEMEVHKNITNVALDTPDVSSNWSTILSTIFGAPNDKIKPQVAMTPDTVLMETSSPPAPIVNKPTPFKTTKTPVTTTDKATTKLQQPTTNQITSSRKPPSAIKLTTKAPEATTLKVTTKVPEPTTVKLTTRAPEPTTIKLMTRGPEPTTIKLMTKRPEPSTVKLTTTVPETPTVIVMTRVPEVTTAKVLTKMPEPTTVEEMTKVTESTTKKDAETVKDNIAESTTANVEELTPYPIKLESMPMKEFNVEDVEKITSTEKVDAPVITVSIISNANPVDESQKESTEGSPVISIKPTTKKPPTTPSATSEFKTNLQKITTINKPSVNPSTTKPAASSSTRRSTLAPKATTTIKPIKLQSTTISTTELPELEKTTIKPVTTTAAPIKRSTLAPATMKQTPAPIIIKESTVSSMAIKQTAVPLTTRQNIVAATIMKHTMMRATAAPSTLKKVSATTQAQTTVNKITERIAEFESRPTEFVQIFEPAPTTIRNEVVKEQQIQKNEAKPSDSKIPSLYLIDHKTNTKIPITTKEQLTTLLDRLPSETTTEIQRQKVSTINTTEINVATQVNSTEQNLSSSTDAMKDSLEVASTENYSSSYDKPTEIDKILDQLLLTSTNIYDINTELASKSSEETTENLIADSTNNYANQNEQTSTAENPTTNVIAESIEQLIQQAVGILPSDSDVVTLETTTDGAATTTMESLQTTTEEIPTTTGLKESLKESVESLIMQALDTDRQEFTTTDNMPTTTEFINDMSTTPETRETTELDPTTTVIAKNASEIELQEEFLNTEASSHVELTTERLESTTTNNLETSTINEALTTQALAEVIKEVTDNNPKTRTTILAIITEHSQPPILKINKKEDDVVSSSSWSLVPTLNAHNKESTAQSENKPQIVVQPSKPVDLGMQLGLGLEDSIKNQDVDIKQFVALCNELAFGFWNSVTNGISAARSTFISPFAATSLLAMVFLGARGATSGEMNEILKLDDMVTFNPHLIFKNVTESIEANNKTGVATSIIIRELYSDKSKGNLLNFYKERARQFYDGHVEEVSFKEVGDVIRKRTNMMVKRHTNGKISEYMKDSSIKVKAPLAGVSISVFQSDCSQASTEGRDGELHFVVLPSIRQRRLIPVPAAVWRSGFLAGYEPTLDATAVSIGANDQIISTIFVIPGQQGIAAPGDGLARLERHLMTSAFKDGSWSRLLRSLIPRPGLEVQIPRFSHRSIINATVALQNMGMKDLFDSSKADLRGLNGVANDLYLSDILQVNQFATCGESGIGEYHHSEIYPATANRTYRRSRKFKDVLQADDALYDSEFLEEPRDYQRAFHDPLHDPSLFSLPLPLRPRQARLPEAPRLRFDRPFLYFVRHNPTGLILHMGRFNPRLLP